MHLVRNVLAREFRQRLGGGDLHRVVDGRRAHVERAAEDVGEAQDVVHLVRVIAAAGRDDRVLADRSRLLGRDLGVRIGHGEDDRLVGHRLHHVLGQRALHGQAEEDVRALHRLGQRARLGLRGMRGLPLVHALGAPLVHHALGVAEDHVLGPHPHRLQQLDAGDRRGARAIHHEAGLAQVAAGQMRRVDQPGRGNDRCAVLVVVEDRNVHQLAQPLLDDEALGRLDVLEIDAAEARAEIAHRVDEFVHVLGTDLEVDAVHVGEALEQRDLAFHHRLGRDGAEIAETEHGRAVRDHRDHVALGRVVVSERRIARDVQAGLRDARRVGERQVAGRGDRLGDARLQLAGAAIGMHGKRFFRRDARGAGVDAAVSHGFSPLEAFRIVEPVGAAVSCGVRRNAIALTSCAVATGLGKRERATPPSVTA